MKISKLCWTYCDELDKCWETKRRLNSTCLMMLCTNCGVRRAPTWTLLRCARTIQRIVHEFTIDNEAPEDHFLFKENSNIMQIRNILINFNKKTLFSRELGKNGKT